jgi:predicted dehydrogenase
LSLIGLRSSRASGSSHGHQSRRHPCQSLALAPGSRKSVSAILGFEDGSRGSIPYLASGDAGCPEERIEVFCDRRVFVIDDFESLTTNRGGRRRTERCGRADKSHKGEMGAFVAMLRGAQPRTLPFEVAVVSTVATFKVVESLATGLPGRLAYLHAQSKRHG